MNLIDTLLRPETSDTSLAATSETIARIEINAQDQQLDKADSNTGSDEISDDDDALEAADDIHATSPSASSVSSSIVLSQLQNIKQDLGVIRDYVDYVTSHAEKKSVGACAKYVRLALNSAGIKTPNNPRDANGYIEYLPLIGFSRYDLELTDPVKVGDIEVLPKVGSHKYGHIQVFNGKNWVSDFEQKSEFPSAQYLESARKRGKRIIFRLSHDM